MNGEFGKAFGGICTRLLVTLQGHNVISTAEQPHAIIAVTITVTKYLVMPIII